MTNKEENQCDTNAEVVAEVIEKNPVIGIIMAIGFAAGCITAAIFAIIYAVNWVNDTKPKPTTHIYAPAPDSNYRPY